MIEESQEFGMNSALWLAQGINVFVIVLILALPFLLWKWFKKKERETNQRLDRIEQKIDNLRQEED